MSSCGTAFIQYARKFLAGAALFAILFPFVSCREGGEPRDNGKIVAAVTIVPEETFVRAVAGEKVKVVTLVPPGASPETYEPSPAIMQNFENAAVYFALGVPVEEAYIIPKAPKGVKIVRLEKEVGALYPDIAFESGGRDPHIWLSPRRAAVMVDAVARELSALDPENSEFYHANAADYKMKLDALDSEIREILRPVQDRIFIAYHPAFGYFADDYGITMEALEEEGKEITIARLKEMVDLAKAEGIKVIFYQEEIDAAKTAAFAREIGGRAVMLSPLSGDYIENLKETAEIFAAVLQ